MPERNNIEKLIAAGRVERLIGESEYSMEVYVNELAAELADALERTQTVVEAAQHVDVIVAAHYLEEAAKREPGPWATPHIEALEKLGEALDALAALEGDGTKGEEE